MDTKEGQQSYTVEQAARICKVRASTIRYWLGPYGKAITAEVADTGRQGSRKLLSPRNLVQIRAAFLLSDAGWPKAAIARELPRILSPKQQDWYTPGSQVWGKVEWLIFADRKIRSSRWSLLSIGAPEPGAPSPGSGLVQALAAHGGDFESITLMWPDGYQPVGDFDEFSLRDWAGVRRLTIVNIEHVKRHVVERA